MWSSLLYKKYAANQFIFPISEIWSLNRNSFFQKFDSRKKGDVEITTPFRERLVQYLDNLQLTLVKTLESYLDSLKYYSDTLEKSIEEAASYLSEGDFIKLHQNTKKEAQSQVWKETEF